MIELSKKYRTRNGREARLYVVDAGGDSPIHGAIKELGIWHVAAWGSDGRSLPAPYSYSHSISDLIEMKPSAIEEMIAWLEEQSSPNLFWGDNQRDAFDLALIKARRIRDSNATSDE